MSLLVGPTCPQCGAPAPVVRVWWKADTARGLFLRRVTGVVCLGCHKRLVILQARVVVSGIVIFVFGIALSVYLIIHAQQMLSPKLSDSEVAVAFGILGTLVAVAHFRLSPRFAQLRLATNGETVDYPLFRVIP